MRPSRAKLSVHTGQYAEDIMELAGAAFLRAPFFSVRLPAVPGGF